MCTFDTTVYMGGGVGGSGYDGDLCFRADLLCCKVQTRSRYSVDHQKNEQLLIRTSGRVFIATHYHRRLHRSKRTFMGRFLVILLTALCCTLASVVSRTK